MRRGSLLVVLRKSLPWRSTTSTRALPTLVSKRHGWGKMRENQHEFWIAMPPVFSFQSFRLKRESWSMQCLLRLDSSIGPKSTPNTLSISGNSPWKQYQQSIFFNTYICSMIIYIYVVFNKCSVLYIYIYICIMCYIHRCMRVLWHWFLIRRSQVTIQGDWTVAIVSSLGEMVNDRLMIGNSVGKWSNLKWSFRNLVGKMIG